jgi:predicted dehydrogenase
MDINKYSRRRFIKNTSAAVAGTILANQAFSIPAKADRTEKMRIALVGTGVRGVGMYGRTLMGNYGDFVEMVGMCDSNPGRLRYAREYIGVDCPVFDTLGELLRGTKPEWLIVTTWDWEHHKVIIEGLQHGCNIICEKPLTIDEIKAQAILDAEKRSGKRIIVTFNYRYPPYRAKIKELLMKDMVGKVNSVDFHWNIDHSHLMRYMQRWHGHSDRGGTLWVHKSTHHFDMINWFLDSDPLKVQAYSSLDRFGKHGSYRGAHCRKCAHTERCAYYWNIEENEHLYNLYTQNEHFDGYIRDSCVFRETIDSYERHAALVKYANGAYLNYSLTGDTDYSGYWLAFNGSKGRLELRAGGWPSREYNEIVFTPIDRYSDMNPQTFRIPHGTGGHWGGDPIMMDKLFKYPDTPDPLHQQAGTRDGVMSILVGIAARKSVASGKSVSIEELTEIKPAAKRPRRSPGG